ncbi:MAG: restriction endonuclease [Planctomycetota bacterium]|nr:restriction endonuclease [Planctomycetota bacterium]
MIRTAALIESSPPHTWRQLQDRVARIYRESGWQADVESNVETVRGPVNIDVLARDPRPCPPVTALCECKHWRKRVPKTIVHSLRTVVTDFGANWGIIVSSGGFQKGTHEAAEHSNIQLLDWAGFQELMRDQWIREFMVPQLFAANEPLVEYTEPINARILRKADNLSKSKQATFRRLRAKYLPLATMLTPVQHHFLSVHPIDFVLPLKARLTGVKTPPDVAVPSTVLSAKSLRRLLVAYSRAVSDAAGEFDTLFGERA